MITQQQRKELTLAAVDCEHQINADCIRLWRDPTKEGTALAQLMDRIEAKVRQYIQQSAPQAAPQAEQAADTVTYVDFQQRRGRDADILDEAISAYNSWMLDDDYDATGALHRIFERVAERRAAATQPQQEQSK